MEFACTKAPPVKAAMAHHRANQAAPSRHPSRPLIYSMGPPSQPSAVLTRYLTAKAFSAKLVIIPSRADTHIQNTAPGPPKKSAVATPATAPVPMVEANAVARVCIWLSPCPPPRSVFSAPTEPFHQVFTPKIWKNPLLTEHQSPTSKNAPSSQGRQSPSVNRSTTDNTPFGKVYAPPKGKIPPQEKLLPKKAKTHRYRTVYRLTGGCTPSLELRGT